MAVKKPNIKKSELGQIKVFLKEIKIIDELNINYPKYLRNQCEECDTDIKFLPAIQFHHIKDEKNISWDEIKYLPYKTVRKLMMHEDLKVICNNCHLKKQATIYHQFRDFINSLNLNRDTIKATKRLINEELNKRDIKINKKRIRAWIYKKYLIEQYYNGECASCGKRCTDDNLPIFIFHHRTKRKTEKWGKMKYKNINEIIKWLKYDKCICLCANCHTMLHSRLYIKYSDIILRSDALKEDLINKISDMKKKIKEFDYKNFHL